MNHPWREGLKGYILRFRLLFGLSCCSFPGLALFAYEFFRQALSSSVDAHSFVFPVFACLVSVFGHIAVWNHTRKSGRVKLTIVRAENEDGKYFDQVIRMLSVSAALIGARFFLFDITPAVWLTDHYYLVVFAAEFSLMGLLCALCMRSLPFQANLLMLVSQKQIWKCSVTMNSGREFRVYIISDEKKLLQSMKPVFVREIVPYEVYSGSVEP